MRLLGLAFALVCLIGTARPAAAVPVSFTLSGTVTTSTIPAISPGAAWSVTVFYNSSATPIVDTPTLAIYDAFQITGFSIAGVTNVAANQITIEDGATRDLVLVQGDTTPTGELTITLTDEDAEEFDSTGLPEVPIDVAMFEDASFELILEDLTSAQGTVSTTSIQFVPEPGTLALVALGAGALAFASPRRPERD